MAISEAYQEIVDFLLKPENIASALDLVDVVPLAIDRLHIKFWETLKEIVEEGLSQRNASNWIVGLWGESETPAVADDFLKPGWSLFQLTPDSVEDMRLYWAFWVEQAYRTSPRKSSENEFALLTSGLGFHSEDERRKKLQAAKLPQWAQQLFDHPGRLRGGWKSDDKKKREGWVVYKETAKLRARGEILRLAQGNSLEEEVAGALLELFDENRKNVEAENAKLRKSKL